MDVIMLAGGSAGPELKEFTDNGYKSLLKFGDEFMINLTLRAFKESKLRGCLFLLAAPEVKNLVKSDYYDHFIPEGADIFDNVLKALSHDKIDKSKKIMITSCDIPLISHQAVDNFIGYSQNVNCDAIYPLVEKSVYDAKFAGTRRSWYYCKDGTYTGGNFICVKPDIFFKNKDMFIDIFENRKNPVKIAALFGVKLLLKYKMGLASKKDALDAVYNVIKTPCAAFESKYAEIVFDIDKASDYIKCVEYIKNKCGRPRD